ncbi:TetR/AcrR family transcriptional regulator [Leucobacter rhizosphaerae]|uniref:TetR/AcrR family transcriptional regulator n=1 Tax=Leucobacter rhizosphaerae TaxID=2932245 RepID=A0ABY4FTX7_9MICO|nr:TetR/AcrR family transcriptional regulator [Leucobacter rhizosphaerae]UOQ59723.1 TetR/AcrR family transcriptional regulator [Leucobacter rhizosphaerae]
MAEITLETDPRIVRSRRSVIEATAEVLATEGLIGLTHQNIARRSGVSRATIYRHWPTREDLVVVLLESFSMPHFLPSSGTARQKLQRNIGVQLDALLDPHYRAVYLTAQSVADLPAVKERLRVINIDRVESLRRLLEPEYRLADAEQVTDVLALLIGPLLQYATFVGAVSERLTSAIIDAVVEYLDRYCRVDDPEPPPASSLES